jgi:type VI protein secretion system component VasK
MSVYEQLFKNYIESDQIGNKKIEERDQKKVENILQYFAEVMLLKTIFLKKPVSFSHNYRPFTEAKLKKIGNSIYKNLLLNRDKILTSNKYFLDGGLVYIHNYNKIGLKLQKFNLISHVGQYVVSDASIGFKRLKDNTTKKTVQLVILKLPLRTIIIPLDKFSQETLIENSKKYLDDAWLYKEVYKPWSLQKPERYPLISSQEPKHVQIIEKNIEAGLAKRLIC